MMTAAQVLDAADLLAERDELLDTLERMRKAKLYKIEYGDMELAGQGDEIYDRFSRDGETKHLPITAAIRKLFQSETEERVAAIDAKLIALGVQPPSTPEEPR